MKFAWMIKVRGEDLYLLPDMSLGPKRDERGKMQAVVEKLHEASHRAKRKFGENWGDFAEIVEANWEEFVGYNGRKGGSKLTRKKRKQLKRIAHLPRKWKRRKLGRKRRTPKKKPGPKVKPLYWWSDGHWAVCHFFIGLANRTVRRVDKSIRLGDLRRYWNKIEPVISNAKRPCVFVAMKEGWTQVL